MTVPAVHLREVGAATGHKVRLPTSWAALLAVASRHVFNGTAQVTHVFDVQGDLISELDLVDAGDVLYVSTNNNWRKPPSDHSRRSGGGTGGNSARTKRSSLQDDTTALAAQTSSTPLGSYLLPAALVATPLVITNEAPVRLCAARPPWGLAGDHTQLGSDANFTRLRGQAKQQAFLKLCANFARRMQQRLGTWPVPFSPSSNLSCAVVGSGGGLAHSGYGAAIDAHDVVMRFNLAPAGGALRAHVGGRTTLRVLTDKSYQLFLRTGVASVASMATNHSARANRMPRAKGQGRVIEPDAVLLLYCMAQGWVGKCMHDARMDHVNPVFVRHLRTHLDEYLGRGRLPSAGLVGMAMAISHCSHVTLFGFGNASNASTTEECGHYWECSRQQSKYFAGKAGYHDWNAQWRLVSTWLSRAAANASHAGQLTFRP